MSTQAEFWNKSWDWEHTKNRAPIFGYSAGIYDTPKLAKDQVLPFLQVPAGANLSLNEDWNETNKTRLQAAEKFLTENNELMNLLQENLAVVDYQQYNLLVLRSVAKLCRQSLNMLLGLQRINTLLNLSSTAASLNAGLAVSLLDQALEEVKIMRSQRNETLQEVTAVWYQDWYPRVHEANGRKYLDQVDDVKDHRPTRTVDMSYLIYRQLKFRLGKWAEDVLNARNQFAKTHSLPLKNETFNWESIDL